MRLPEGTKFNKTESAYFWAIRYWYKYANDKNIQYPTIFNSVMDVFGTIAKYKAIRKLDITEDLKLNTK